MHDHALRGGGDVGRLLGNGHLLGKGRGGEEEAAQGGESVCVLVS
jgi:hypothetical protein